MKKDIYFLKSGKYKNGTATIVITENDVEKKTLYSIEANNAMPYVEFGYAVMKGFRKNDTRKPEEKETKKSNGKVVK